MRRSRAYIAASAIGGVVVGWAVVPGVAPPAHADAVAYLVNVTVRPGYNFINADQALAYGHGVCDKISVGVPFTQIVRDIKVDFNTPDDYQGTYLIAQSAQELCPANIWQMRRSAADYRPPA